MKAPLGLLSFTLLTTPPVTNAQTLLDGDFDSIAIGDAPSVGVTAGAWFFPQDYVDAGFGETNMAEFTITEAPGGTSQDRCLRVAATPSDGGHQHLVNLFTAPLLESVGTNIVVSFEVYVPSGVAAGPGIYLGTGGWNNSSQRGPQLAWHSSGTLTAIGVGRIETILMSPYPRDVWQSVRLEIDMVADTYCVFSAVRGSSLELIGSHLQFRSGPQNVLDRFTVARFSDIDVEADAYIDNVSVAEVAVSSVSLTLQSSGNEVIVSWPTNATGFTLQSALNLTPPVTWLDVTNPPAVNGGQFVVTNPVSATSQFFRLKKQ